MANQMNSGGVSDGEVSQLIQGPFSFDTAKKIEELNKRGAISPDVYNRFQQSIGGQAYASQNKSPETLSGDVAKPEELAVVTNPIISYGAQPQQTKAPQIPAVSIPAPQHSVGAQDFDRAYMNQKRGIMGQAEAESQKSDELAQNMLETQSALDKFEANRLSREQERQKTMNDERGKLESEISKLGEMKEDPSRYWSNIGTEKKVLWALGAFFSGMSGKNGNAALEMLQRTVEADVAAQRSDIDRAKFGVSRKESILSRMREQFGDERQAESAARVAIIDRMKTQAEMIAAKYNNPVTKAKALEFMGKADEERAKALMGFDQQSDLLGMKRAELSIEAQKSSAKANADARVAELKASLGGDPVLEALPKEDRERYVKGPNFQGLAPSAERAKVLNSLSTDVKTADDSISRLLEIKRKYGRQALPSEVSAEADTLRSMLQGSLRTALVGPGAVSDTERKLIESVIADPTAVWSMNSDTRLKALQLALKKKLNTAARAEGIKVRELDIRPNE